MTTGASRDELLQVALTHAKAEAEGDIEATMATLEDNPAYELQPAGLLLPGRDAARRYYEYFFATFSPKIAGYAMRGEWLIDEGLGQEYTLWTRTGPGGSLERHEIIGLLKFGTTLLAGERIYGSDGLLRVMFGPLYEEARPLDVGTPPAD